MSKTKKTATSPVLEARPTVNHVWIEVERPRKLPKGQANADGGASDLAHAEEICKRVNNMLQRLMPGTSYKFWWNSRFGGYSLTTSEAGTYTDLRDSGHWFNLDYLGRDIEVKEQA